ncbi:MAG TPA: isoprenylcysteine carboxylmethyltransferase family protein [Terriglobales bacterium]|nr:isoprenylcysteine carboxylmethyltransferase family protein [Terriglobales bacterium]
MSEVAPLGRAPRGWARVARRIRVPLGFLFAAVYLWLAVPGLGTILVGAVLIAAGLAVRAIASGQLRKNEQLATAGPYSYTRNPLYLGSMLIAVGFAFASRSIWIWIVLAGLFVCIYVPVIRSEEAFLRETFPEFAAYAQRVPRLWPRWSGEALLANFSRELYWQHREYNAWIGAGLMLLAIILKMALTTHVPAWDFRQGWH